MKLYILTSTLNFHSIMATESCSPSACYARRGFGDSYFYVAGSFAKKNSIILFNKYPKCVMPVTEEEQYSLVMEIDTEKTANFEFEEIGRHNDVVVYQTRKTIYLNPMGCKLLFESNSIRDLILSRAKVRSLDAKTLFYEKAGSFAIPRAESFVYSKEYIEPYSDVEFDEDNLANDKKINKCKGFLYAYLIGANTSPGEGVSKMQQSLKELSNLIHARIINNDFRLHTERINELQREFECVVRKYDVISKKLSESANRLNASTAEMLQNELVNLGVWEFLACKMFSLPSLSSIYTSEQWDNVKLKITQFIARVSSTSSNRLIVDEIPAIHDYEPPFVNLRGSNQETEIYTAWIKLLLNPECNLKEFFANKLSLLKSLGIAAKGIMGDDTFAHSPERDYYNGLIKNIREAEDFDLSSLNSMIWQSLAICAKATNPDVDALYSLMTSCAVEDYRCAVAMWGAMCGYADMPKTFFNRIIEGVSVQDAYEYSRCIEKRIHGFERSNLVVPNPQNSEGPEMKLCTEPIVQNNKAESRTEISPLQSLVGHEELRMSSNLVDIIWQFFRSSAFKGARKKEKLTDGLRLCLERNKHMTDVSQIIFDLNDFEEYGWSKNNKPWKTMQEHFCPDYNQRNGKPIKKRTQTKNLVQLDIFDNNETGLQNLTKTVNEPIQGGSEDNILKEETKQEPFVSENVMHTVSRYDKSILEDKKWINECASLISNPRAKSKFIEDMEWFVGNHNDTYNDKNKGVVPGRYAGHDRTNERVLERIKAYLNNKVNPRNENMQWVANIYSNIPVIEIVDYITKEYGV